MAGAQCEKGATLGHTYAGRLCLWQRASGTRLDASREGWILQACQALEHELDLGGRAPTQGDTGQGRNGVALPTSALRFTEWEVSGWIQALASPLPLGAGAACRR